MDYPSASEATLDSPQVAKTFWSTSIRYWSDTSALDRILIDVNPRLFVIWVMDKINW